MLSLIDLCRLSIRDSIENGTIQYLHHAPRKIRQSMLDAILMHATVNNPNCLKVLSCPEFFRDFSSLNVEWSGSVEAEEYLHRVARSMSTILPNGKTYGENISSLRVSMCGRGLFYPEENCWEAKDLHLGNFIDLISQCPNLKSLRIRVVRLIQTMSDIETSNWTRIFDVNEREGDDLLNKIISINEQCQSIFENLQQLAFIGTTCLDGWRSLKVNNLIGNPLIKFKNLTSLHLVSAYVERETWRQLILSVRNTLTYLRLEKFYAYDDPIDDYGDLASLLPMSLPNLKYLKLKPVGGHRSTKSFVDNLQKCSNLEYAFLELSLSYGWSYSFYTDGVSMDKSSLTALSRMKIPLVLRVWINVEGMTNDCKNVIDNSSRFAVIDLLNEKITCLRFQCEKWNSKITTPLEHAFDACKNLRSLNFFSAQEFEKESDRENANRLLSEFFSDKEKTSKLRKLKLRGDIDYKILRLVFENCLNLESFGARDCSQLVDDHLIEWTRLGARPSKLRIECRNVGDAGLVPILINSNNRLNKFVIGSEMERVTERTWRALIDNCRCVERIESIPANLVELARSKCFNFVEYPDDYVT